MLPAWVSEFESLDAIARDDDTRRVFLRMAWHSREGRLSPFLRELASDGDLDAGMKATLAEIAEDAVFLHGFAEYVDLTRILH